MGASHGRRVTSYTARDGTPKRPVVRNRTGYARRGRRGLAAHKQAAGTPPDPEALLQGGRQQQARWVDCCARGQTHWHNLQLPRGA